MDKRGFVLCLILLIQACGPLLAQTSAPADSAGLMQRWKDRATEAKEKMQRVGQAVLGLAGAYYEDHLQPVVSSYYQRVSTWRDNLWENMQSKISSYNPFGEK
ncbi:hypothetical protein NL108_000074 [Boleophthalmus pectinirostris]|uniref:apolipoprotein C-IV n=1 Tax=Boleophthalmus pectinirostris TaxID=150288 RepID=UPI00242E7279|nr:apolipoprotein C-IV [Boleophthalmus pectinirostris]KAJ0065849.1 hypothetical protein NL108_000074 [Boleophthalmus pectinirostris]